MNDRSHIHWLAALVRIQTNFKLSMQECLNVVEGAFTEAEIIDAETQRKLAEEEKAAQPPRPITDKVQ